MLPKQKRLTAKEFRGLRTKIIYRGAYFDVAATASETTKYACIVAKKRIKRAVDRNKARRKIYMILSECEPSSPLYVLVYPTKQILSTPYAILQEEMKKVFATL